jgi:hypothetical protein
MHDCSKSSQRTEAEVLELSIKVSRKHWGSWLSPLRWRCEFSYWLLNRQRHERARHHARRAEEAFSTRRYRMALAEFMGTLITSPRMARDRLLYGWLAAKGVRLFERLAVNNEGFTGRYADGWIGPIYRDQVRVPEDGKRIVITTTHHPQPTHRKIRTQLLINSALADSKVVEEDTTFALAADVESYRGKTVSLEIRTDSYFSPSDLHGGEDRRHLSIRLNETNISTN